MTKDSLPSESEWDTLAIEEADREILVRNVETEGANQSAQLIVTVASVSTDHKLQRQVYCSYEDKYVTIVLHNSDSGPVTEEFFELARAIDAKIMTL